MRIKLSLIFALILLLIVSVSCKEETTGSDAESFDEAVRLMDAKICEQIKDHDFKSECYAKIALEFKDIGVCESAARIDNNLNCKYIWVSETDDLGVCENITQKADKVTCYAYAGFLSKDTSICNNFPGQGGREVCTEAYHIMSGDYKFCKSSKDPEWEQRVGFKHRLRGGCTGVAKSDAIVKTWKVED